MRVLSIDPGPESSAIVYYDADEHRLIWGMDQANAIILQTIRAWPDSPHGKLPTAFVIEGIENQGHIVGKTTFLTAELIGRFREAWEFSTKSKSYRIYRRDVKICLCGGTTYRSETGAAKTVNDTIVANAVRERFPATGGGSRPEVGTKKQPGPLFGIKGSHQYSALALALTWCEKMKQMKG